MISSKKNAVLVTPVRFTIQPPSARSKFRYSARFGGSATENLIVDPVTESVMFVLAERLVVAGPRIVRVAWEPAASVLWESVIGSFAANTSRFETTPVEPEVFPMLDIPALSMFG